MAEEKGLLELKENINSHVMRILDAQEMPDAEKQGVKEFFSYMVSLKPEDLMKLRKDPKFIEASIAFKKDRSQSEIIINVCNQIIQDA